jgi:hypothetical protein
VVPFGLVEFLAKVNNPLPHALPDVLDDRFARMDRLVGENAPPMDLAPLEADRFVADGVLGEEAREIGSIAGIVLGRGLGVGSIPGRPHVTAACGQGKTLEAANRAARAGHGRDDRHSTFGIRNLNGHDHSRPSILTTVLMS